MIRHIVCFKFLDQADGRGKLENMDIAKAKLEALPAQIPQIVASQVRLGRQDADPDNFDLVLTSDFADMDDLNAYIVHPAHQAVGVFMRKVRCGKARVDVEM